MALKPTPKRQTQRQEAHAAMVAEADARAAEAKKAAKKAAKKEAS